MNRVFYIFRHGETDWNREKRCQGHTNVDLNENGLNQARELAEKLKDLPIEVIVTSDLNRAFVTGSMVAQKKEIPLIVDPRLREMSYGQAEGLLYEEAIEKFGPEIWKKLQSFKREHDQVTFPRGETRLSSRMRFHQALIHLIESSSYEVIGISTHGGAIRNFLHSLLPEDYPVLPIPNCVIYKCLYLHDKQDFEVILE